jgi:hypothetical protein
LAPEGGGIVQETSRTLDTPTVKGVLTEMANTKTKPDLDLWEHRLGEVAEACQKMLELRDKLRQAKRGGEPYFELMADMAVCGDVLRAKLDSLAEFIESL